MTVSSMTTSPLSDITTESAPLDLSHTLSALDCHKCMMDMQASSCFRCESRHTLAFQLAHGQLVVRVHCELHQSIRNSPRFRGFFPLRGLFPHFVAYVLSLDRTTLLFSSGFPPDFMLFDHIDRPPLRADIHHRDSTCNN